MRDYYNISDCYSYYIRDSKKIIDKKDYIKICNDFMCYLFNELINKGEIVLPLKLGKISILGKKVNFKLNEGKIEGLAPDWVSTKKLWEEDKEARDKKQLVYHFNENTNGVRYKFYWNKSKVLVSNKSLFRLKMSRANKRTLSKLVKNGKEYLIK